MYEKEDALRGLEGGSSGVYVGVPWLDDSSSEEDLVPFGVRDRGSKVCCVCI